MSFMCKYSSSLLIGWMPPWNFSAFYTFFVDFVVIFCCFFAFRALQVRKEHFPVVGDALVATLSLALGKDFTAEMRQSWVAVYALMSNIMVSTQQ